MSILLACIAGHKLTFKQLMEISGGADYFREIGICFISPEKGGEIERKVNFDTLTEVFDFIYSRKIGACIIYANNPANKFYSKIHFAPILLSPEYAYASCGDFLAHKPSDKYVSDATLFKQSVIPDIEGGPDLFQNPAFAWMMQRIAREYVGMVFLRRNGTFVIINHNLFDYTDGVYSMDFTKAKAEITSGKKLHKNSAKNVEVMAA